MDFRSFKHRSLIVVEVPLTEEEIEECLEMGKRRTELDEKKLGWTYRHHGKKSERAHAIGFMGEVAFEKWLQSEGMIEDRDYVRNDPFVETHEEIKQDFTIASSDIGVKSADDNSLQHATSYGHFLYPAKSEEDESKRILPYPDYLVQTVVSVDKKKCWICGFVEEETIKQSPIRPIWRKSTHVIPIGKYRPIKELFKMLKTN